jgi:hypothetical protein
VMCRGVVVKGSSCRGKRERIGRSRCNNPIGALPDKFYHRGYHVVSANLECSSQRSLQWRECSRHSEACEGQSIPEALGYWNTISNRCAACALLICVTSTHKSTITCLLGHGFPFTTQTITATSGANSPWTASNSSLPLGHQELNIQFECPPAVAVHALV